MTAEAIAEEALNLLDILARTPGNRVLVMERAAKLRAALNEGTDPELTHLKARGHMRHGKIAAGAALIVDILARTPEPALGRCFLCAGVTSELVDLLSQVNGGRPVPVTGHTDMCPWKLAQDYMEHQERVDARAPGV